MPGMLLFILGLALGITVSHWFFILSAIPIVITLVLGPPKLSRR